MAAKTEQAPEVRALIWTEPEPDGALLKPPLTRAEIVAALLRIADTEGLAAVSLERLSEELGPAGASLRHHARYQRDLNDLLIDGVFAELVLPERTPGQWRPQLRAAAYQLRAAIGRHPWFVRLTFRRPLFGPRAMDWLEYTMSVLEDAGLDIADAEAYAGIVTGHVLGSALCEAEEQEMERERSQVGDRTSHEWHSVVAPFLDSIITSGKYRAFSRFLQSGARHMTIDETFETSLEALLDGLALRVGQA